MPTMKRLLSLLLLALPVALHAQAIGINTPDAIAPGSHRLVLPATTFGFHVGQTVAQARAATPRRVRLDTLATTPSPLLALDDTLRGVKLWMTPSDGVGIIEVSKRTAGDLLGVRVGDVRSSVLTRLGLPADARSVGGIWMAGTDKIVTVQWDPMSGKVVKIVVAHAR